MRLLKQAALPVAIGLIALSSSVAAQAADAKAPEFYGMLYLSLDHKNMDSTTGSNPWELNSNSSRLGVKHEIPLENGLTAVLKAEFGIKVDDGKSTATSTFSQRDIYAGLKGSYGQVVAGRFNTPLRKTEGKIDPFNLVHGDIKAVLGGQERVSNIIEYTSPKFSNVVVQAAFMPGEKADLDGDGKVNDNNNIADSYSVAAIREQGDLYLAFAFDLNGDATTNTEIKKDAGTLEGGRSDRVQLAGRYQMGAASVGAIVQHAQDSEISKHKENAFTLSSTYVVNNHTYKAQYGINKGGDSKDQKHLAAIGVDYRLDKAAFVTLNYAIRSVDPKGSAKQEDKVLTLGYNLKF